MFINDKAFDVEIYPEEDLTWQQHNEIHQALNAAYGDRTKSFTKKTHSTCVPLKRILCRYEGVLIGHTAVFEDHASVGGEKILIGGVGLTLSLKPRHSVGFFLRQKAAKLLGGMGYPLAIGRIKNSSFGKERFSSLVLEFLDIPLIGKSTKSHEWETLAIYDVGAEKTRVHSIVSEFKKEGYVRIEGEIF